MKWCLLSLVILSGCAGHTHTKVHFASGTPHAGMHVHVHGGSGLAALLAVTILAAGVVETERARYSANPFFTVSESNPHYAPEMAADRKVSEQDCTKPIDHTLGNIRCK